VAQRLVNGGHNPCCNMNSNSSLVALSFSGARRRALAVTGCFCVIIAYNTPCWTSLGAIELHISDGNSLSISRYTAAMLHLRQGICKAGMLAIQPDTFRLLFLSISLPRRISTNRLKRDKKSISRMGLFTSAIWNGDGGCNAAQNPTEEASVRMSLS